LYILVLRAEKRYPVRKNLTYPTFKVNAQLTPWALALACKGSIDILYRNALSSLAMYGMRSDKAHISTYQVGLFFARTGSRKGQRENS
jgi:hypothetical protein